MNLSELVESKPMLTRADKMEITAIRKFLDEMQGFINTAKSSLDKIEADADELAIGDLNNSLAELGHDEALGELEIELEMYDEYDKYIPQTRYYGRNS